MMKILIVDAQELFAEGLGSVLVHHDMQVVGIATRGSEAVTLARSRRPDVVLVDIGLPDMSGLATGRNILAEQPTVRVVALAALEDRSMIHEALKSGFSGYIMKTGSLVELLGAIQAAVRSHMVIPEHSLQPVVGTVTDQMIEEQGVSPNRAISRLTEREREVLALLVDGASGREIADRLYLSPNTVRTHIQNLMSKLQVHSRLEAVALAARHGSIRSRMR